MNKFIIGESERNEILSKHNFFKIVLEEKKFDEESNLKNILKEQEDWRRRMFKACDILRDNSEQVRFRGSNKIKLILNDDVIQDINISSGKSLPFKKDDYLIIYESANGFMYDWYKKGQNARSSTGTWTCGGILTSQQELKKQKDDQAVIDKKKQDDLDKQKKEELEKKLTKFKSEYQGGGWSEEKDVDPTIISISNPSTYTKIFYDTNTGTEGTTGIALYRPLKGGVSSITTRQKGLVDYLTNRYGIQYTGQTWDDQTPASDIPTWSFELPPYGSGWKQISVRDAGSIYGIKDLNIFVSPTKFAELRRGGSEKTVSQQKTLNVTNKECESQILQFWSNYQSGISTDTGEFEDTVRFVRACKRKYCGTASKGKEGRCNGDWGLGFIGGNRNNKLDNIIDFFSRQQNYQNKPVPPRDSDWNIENPKYRKLEQQ